MLLNTVFEPGKRLFDGKDFQALVDAINTIAAEDGLSLTNTNITTVGAGTLTAAAIVGGLITRSGPTAVFTDTTATAAQIIAAVPTYVVGETFYLYIKNTTAFAQTLSAGVGVTLPSPGLVIPANSTGLFSVQITSPTAVVFTQLATTALSNKAPQVATALTTVGAGTITAAGIAGSVTTRGGAQSATAFTDTTDTAANIIAAQPNARIGLSWEWTYKNNTDAVATVTGGTGATVSVNTTVPPDGWVTYLVTYTAAATVTLVGIRAGRNILQNKVAAVATPDTGTTQTLTAAMVTGADFVAHVSAGGTTPSLTMPLATDLIAAIPGWQIGQSYVLRVINTNSGTATIVTNTGITTSGTLTLATQTTRDFIIAMTAAATISMTSVGTGTNS